MPKSKARSRVCQFCKKEYQLNVDGGMHRYCSVKCRQQWHYDRWKSTGNKRCAIKTRSYQLKTNYGITVDDFDIMFEGQGKCCKICKKENITGKNWHVDHSHINGKIRGILCQKCNQALGMVYDDVLILEKMIEYLKENNEQ